MTNQDFLENRKYSLENLINRINNGEFNTDCPITLEEANTALEAEYNDVLNQLQEVFANA